MTATDRQDWVTGRAALTTRARHAGFVDRGSYVSYCQRQQFEPILYQALWRTVVVRRSAFRATTVQIVLPYRSP